MSKNVSQLILDSIGVGEDNATHSKRLIDISGLTERELRKVIEQLRRSGTVIISSNKGYYLPETVDELQHYINKESKRAKSIFYTLKTAKVLEKTMLNRSQHIGTLESEDIDNGRS
jgi:biotin operon repressor